MLMLLPRVAVVSVVTSEKRGDNVVYILFDYVTLMASRWIPYKVKSLL